MNQYKDTTPPAKPQYEAASGQGKRKKSLKNNLEAIIGMAFLFFFLLSVTTCQPAQGVSNTRALHKHSLSIGNDTGNAGNESGNELSNVGNAIGNGR